MDCGLKFGLNKNCGLHVSMQVQLKKWGFCVARFSLQRPVKIFLAQIDFWSMYAKKV